jgi:hypothetical protein
MIAFISGHGDVTEEEFEQHYVPKINEAIEKGDSFVVGDFRGVDTMAQNYLSSILPGIHKNFRVHHMFTEPRHKALGGSVIGGFQSDKERDSTMTYASDYDIAWVRPGKERSGTAGNLKRRERWRHVEHFDGHMAYTLCPTCVGENPSGWTIDAEVQEDYFKWVNYFEANHPKYGEMRGNFEKKVVAESKEAYDHFFKHHEPDSWDYWDI